MNLRIRSRPAGSSAIEPCGVCGEETAVGSVFFSDRYIVKHTENRQTYLCSLCDSSIRSSRDEKLLTDEEVRQFIETSTAVFIGTSGRF